MKDQHRILKQFHYDSAKNKSFTIYITHHDEGAGDVYRSEDQDGFMGVWDSLDGVKARTPERLREAGHECSDRCSDWEPISN